MKTLRRTFFGITLLLAITPAALAQPNVVAWGDNTYGQTNVPPDLTNAIAVAAGEVHSVALRADGTVVAWGNNAYGQTNVPAGLSNVIAISCDSYSSLALKSDGTAVGWGQYWQLNPPADWSNLVAVAGSGYGSYALRSDGSLRVWRDYAPMPNGLGNVVSLGAPLMTSAGLAAVTVNGTFLQRTSGGHWHIASPTNSTDFVYACSSSGPALTVDGRVRIYSSGQFVDTGLSNIVVISVPKYLSFAPYLAVGSDGKLYNGPAHLSNVVAVASGRAHGVALIGAGPPVFASRPMDLSINPGRTARFYAPATGEWPISYQWKFNGVEIPGATRPMLAVTNVGREDFGTYTVVASNALGATASPGRNLSLLPIAAPDWSANVTGVVAVASYTASQCLALDRSGRVTAWSAEISPESTVPLGLPNFVAISTSPFGLYSPGHSLALTDSGTVYSWGYNYFTNTWPSLTNIAAISAGSSGDVALRNDSAAVVWTEDSRIYPPTVITSFTNTVEVSSGKRLDSHSWLLARADGIAYGNGVSVPANVSNVVSVACGDRYGLALLADGTVAAWGNNEWGQTEVPSGLTNVIAITTGYEVGYGCYSMALREDGTLVAWGLSRPYISNLVATVTNAVMIDGAFALLGQGPPFLTTPLVDRFAPTGGQVFFRALATGGRPLHYQWQLNGADLPGQTRNVLHLTDLQLTQSGRYTVTVTNSQGSITSASSLLTLYDYAPALGTADIAWTSFGDVIWFPETNVTHDGESAAQSGDLSGSGSSTERSTLRGRVQGPGTLTFWWKISGSPASRSLSFYLNEAPGPLFYIRGGTDWEQRTVYLGAGPQILDWAYVRYLPGQYAGWVDEVSFTPGATPPTISMWPTSQSQAPGGNVTFYAVASGTPPFDYHWRFNGADIPGATTSSLTVTNVGPENAGDYHVLVSNMAGSVLSSNVPLVLGRVASWGSWSLPVTITNATALAAGGYYGLALQSDGTVLGWRSYYGETAVPPTVTNASAIEAAGVFGMAVNAADGTVIGWGDNAYEGTNVPTGLSNVLMIAGPAAALRSDGTVVCWGDNRYGQTNVPPDLTNAVYIATSGPSTAALRSDGTVIAWGDNTYGQTNVPPGLTDVVSLSAAGWGCRLALRADGSVVHWGETSYPVVPLPANLSNIVDIASTEQFGLALTDQGKVIFWGRGNPPPETLPTLTAIAAANVGGAGIVGDAPPSPQVAVRAPQVIDGQFHVTVPTVCARVYRLEYKNSLAEPAWQGLPLVAGNGHEQRITDPTPVATQRFYRVRRW